MNLLTSDDFNRINRNLRDLYSETENRPNFRLIWSEDERELRWTNFTPEGLQLLQPVVREMRKYPDISERYVLERLIALPNLDAMAKDGKPTEELYYQAVWTFEVLNDRRERTFIAPNLGACKFVVETILGAIANPGMYTKYKDPELNPETAAEVRSQRLNELQQELFGNESDITDSLSLRKGVAYGQGSSPNSSTPSMKKED